MSFSFIGSQQGLEVENGKLTHASSVLRPNEILRNLPYFCEPIEVDDGELEDLTPGEREEGEESFVSTVGLGFGEILFGDVFNEVGRRRFGVERELTETENEAEKEK